MVGDENGAKAETTGSRRSTRTGGSGGEGSKESQTGQAHHVLKESTLGAVRLQRTGHGMPRNSCGGRHQETIGVHVAEQGQNSAGAGSRATGITPKVNNDC